MELKNKHLPYLLWASRAIAAMIILPSVLFKLTNSIESVFLFSLLEMEPAGRYTIGILELIAAGLFLSPFYFYGAILGAGLMVGAIYFHLTILGLEVRNDGGLLFSMAIVELLCCLFIIAAKKHVAVGMFRKLFPL